MTIAKMVREMIEKGVDPDVIELAVATVEEVMSDRVSAEIPRNSVDAQAEERRRRDRERKRNKRDIPQNSADVCGNPQNSENASLSKEEKKEGKEERGTSQRNVRGHRLPDDWQPSAGDWTEALAQIGEQRARAEIEKFRDHWKQQPGSKGVKLDWNAAWRNWIRRAAEYRGGMNGNRPHHQNGRPSGGTFFDGLRSLAEDIARDGEPPRPADPEIPRGRIEIDG